jgi:polyhydroxyalkanoate synthesis regulator protein
MVLDYQPFRVVNSRTEEDLTRATLLQVITEMEDAGRASPLTNRCSKN